MTTTMRPKVKSPHREDTRNDTNPQPERWHEASIEYPRRYRAAGRAFEQMGFTPSPPPSKV